MGLVVVLAQEGADAVVPGGPRGGRAHPLEHGLVALLGARAVLAVAEILRQLFCAVVYVVQVSLEVRVASEGRDGAAGFEAYVLGLLRLSPDTALVHI